MPAGIAFVNNNDSGSPLRLQQSERRRLKVISRWSIDRERLQGMATQCLQHKPRLAQTAHTINVNVSLGVAFENLSDAVDGALTALGGYPLALVAARSRPLLERLSNKASATKQRADGERRVLLDPTRQAVGAYDFDRVGSKEIPSSFAFSRSALRRFAIFAEVIESPRTKRYLPPALRILQRVRCAFELFFALRWGRSPALNCHALSPAGIQVVFVACRRAASTPPSAVLSR